MLSFRLRGFCPHLAAIGLGLALSAPGCGEDAITDPPPEKPFEFWTPIDLSGQVFMQLLYGHNRLYAAGARFGAYLQDPAYFGTWKNLGLGAPFPTTTIPGSGVYALTFLQDELYAASFLPRSHLLPGIHQWSEDDSTWVPTGDALNDAGVLYLASAGNKNLVAATIWRGILTSQDMGCSWQQTFGQDGNIMGDYFLYDGPRALYAGGETPFFTPFLLRSTDDGMTWENITWKISGASGRVRSIAEAKEPPYPLYVFLRTSVYVSQVDTSSFMPILDTSTSGNIVLNPRDSSELWAAADSLYQSQDGGSSWSGHPLPAGGVRLGEMAVDWDRRLMAVVVWYGSDPGVVYCVNLDASSAPTP